MGSGKVVTQSHSPGSAGCYVEGWWAVKTVAHSQVSREGEDSTAGTQGEGPGQPTAQVSGPQRVTSMDQQP